MQLHGYCKPLPITAAQKQSSEKIILDQPDESIGGKQVYGTFESDAPAASVRVTGLYINGGPNLLASEFDLSRTSWFWSDRVNAGVSKHDRVTVEVTWSGQVDSIKVSLSDQTS